MTMISPLAVGDDIKTGDQIGEKKMIFVSLEKSNTTFCGYMGHLTNKRHLLQKLPVVHVKRIFKGLSNEIPFTWTQLKV